MTIGYHPYVPLFYKIIAPVAFFLVLAGFLFYLFSERSLKAVILREEFLDTQERILSRLNQNISPENFSDPFLSRAQGEFQNFFSDVRSPATVRLTIWNKNLTIVYSDLASIIGYHASSNREVEQALKTKKPFLAVRTQDTGEPIQTAVSDFLEIYVPIRFSGEVVGVVEVRSVIAAVTQPFERQIRIILWSLFIGGLFIIFCISLIIRLFVTDPLHKMITYASEVEKGNFQAKVGIGTKDEVGNLSNALNRMAGGLKRLDELKKEFVFIVAHELRNPITVISGYHQLFVEGDVPKEEAMQAIERATGQLQKLVDDLLEIARSEADKLNIEVTLCDIGKMEREAIQEQKLMADEKNVSVIYDKPPRLDTVLADPVRLKEVLINLISNAIKYNTKGGFVKVSHETTDNEVITHVEDNGFGIPEKEQKKIFEKFFRSEDRRVSKMQGTGLGLFITKEIIERMKGKMWFRSEENKGSKFSFSLPAAQHG